MNPNFPRDGAAQALSSMREAARAKGVQLHILNATSESERREFIAGLGGVAGCIGAGAAVGDAGSRLVQEKFPELGNVRD
jgi:hypothetical protein